MLAHVRVGAVLSHGELPADCVHEEVAGTKLARAEVNIGGGPLVAGNGYMQAETLKQMAVMKSSVVAAGMIGPQKPAAVQGQACRDEAFEVGLETRRTAEMKLQDYCHLRWLEQVGQRVCAQNRE